MKHRRFAITTSLASAFLAVGLPLALCAAIPFPVPKVSDPRLELTLFAAEPDIVTPIGITVDARNRVFVIESHTHLPEKNYPGPKTDRIKVFIDENGDGRPDRIVIFADGFKDAMNLAFSPEGILYVVCAKEVIALYDRDGDLVSEARQTVLRLETQQTYSHSQLLGLTFSADGWMHVSRGNVGGFAYEWRGSEGSKVAGYGSGGDIIRCRPDGSQVQLVATGFWNPFDMKFDAAGRLICVDNDPDSRGPNRLLHIVSHGDYGFKSLYGPSGLHPYDAWDGELPGTLPMIAGTGEAPSGVIECSRAALPEEYRGNILATIWGEHTIQRFRPVAAGVSQKATAEVLIEGGQNFRPVGIEAGPDGVLYITDWVKKDYPNHLHGRIWRLAPKQGVAVMKPRPQFSYPETDPGSARMNALMEASEIKSFRMLQAALKEADPFIRHAATTALGREVFRESLPGSLSDKDPRVRLGAMLALRRANYLEAETVLKKHLLDADEAVRQMALIWTGERVLTSLKAEVEQAVAKEPVSARLVETYIATRHILESDVAGEYQKKTRGFAINHKPSPELMQSIAADSTKPARLRAVALAQLPNPDQKQNLELLSRLARGTDPLMRVEAIRTLARASGAAVVDVLRPIALDGAVSPDIRAEAVLALSQHSPEVRKSLLPLLNSTDEAVHLETVRALRSLADDAEVSQEFEKRLRALARGVRQSALAEQLAFALNAHGSPGAEGFPMSKRPANHQEWEELLLPPGGDPASGERVFYSGATACASCHRVHGRGAQIGPDLSVIARTANRQQLIRHIIDPSADIAPQFQAWTIETTDGESHSGLQLHHRGNSIEIFMLDGSSIKFPGSKVASYSASKTSLMPDGLENTMTVHDFRDLLAFLESLK